MTDREPAVASHPMVRRLAQVLRARVRREEESEMPTKRAAVALILRLSAAGALELLMIKRATFEGDPWSGHVALPGGRQEPGDASLERTAVRETWEETAIDLEVSGRVLGALDDVHPRTPRLPPLVITPFVAVLERDVPLVLSREVADAFWVRVSALQDPVASKDVELEVGGGPRRVSSFAYEDHVIWGLTERILRQFLEIVGNA
ncbi:MAG: CoA pyrophosphatase [Gemmatimonadaceae bacterium]